MSELLYLLALAACPLGMGAMMLTMGRGHGSQPRPAEDSQAELAALRAEIDQLRAERSGTGSTRHRPGRADERLAATGPGPDRGSGRHPSVLPAALRNGTRHRGAAGTAAAAEHLYRQPRQAHVERDRLRAR